MAQEASDRSYEGSASSRMIAQVSLCLMLVCGLLPAAHAQAPAFLVKDINSQPVTGSCNPRFATLGTTSGSNPSALTDVNGTLFFLADDGTHGVELWRSDGTRDGTHLVKDIDPGNASAFGYWYTGSLTVVNDALFLVADNGTGSGELWKSDGTEGGTMRVSPALVASGLRAVNGMLFFFAGTELWKSDGAEGGTVRIADVSIMGGASPSALTAANGMLFFLANGPSGAQVWKSDGSTAGTMPMAEFSLSVLDVGLAAVNGTLFVYASTSQNGFYGRNVDLWKVGGSPAGTVLVKTIEGVSEWGVTAGHVAAVDERLFFVTYAYEGYPPESWASRTLWRSDGTAAGTAPVASLGRAFVYATMTADRPHLIPFDGGVVFTDHEGALLRTNPDATGTMVLKDLRSQSAPVDVGGRLLLQACAPTGGDCGLWESDGTPVGTRRLADVRGGAPTVAGSFAFFAGESSATGVELWAVPLASLGRCGNHNTDAGEDCDTAGESASCDADCTAPACGDASVNASAGEECDDGNTQDGDCCTAICRFEPGGSPCDDSSACNGQETCDGAGQCQTGTPQPAGTPCEDGNACTEQDTCDGAGVCAFETLLHCDDGNVHTADWCDPSSGCTYTVIPCTIAPSCIGACDGNDEVVTIDELMMMVNIALGTDDVTNCCEGDASRDGQITVDELLMAVQNALTDACNGLWDQL